MLTTQVSPTYLSENCLSYNLCITCDFKKLIIRAQI